MASLHMVHTTQIVIFLELPLFQNFRVYDVPSSDLNLHHILIRSKWNSIPREQNDDIKVLVGNINNVHHFKHFSAKWQ